MTDEADCPSMIRLAGSEESDSQSAPGGGHVKRPMNPFMVWAKTRRKAIAAANPKMHNSEISRKLGEEWKTMPAEEKQQFMDEATRLKTEHKLAHPEYKYKPKSKKRPPSGESQAPGGPQKGLPKQQQSKQPKLQQQQQKHVQQQQQLSEQQDLDRLNYQQHQDQLSHMAELNDPNAPIAVPQHSQQLQLLVAHQGHHQSQLAGSGYHHQMVFSPEQPQFYQPPYVISLEQSAAGQWSTALQQFVQQQHQQQQLQQQQQQQQQQQHHYSLFSQLEAEPLAQHQQHSQQLYQQHMYSGLTAAYSADIANNLQHQQQQQLALQVCEQIPVPSNQSSSAYSVDYDVGVGGGHGGLRGAEDGSPTAHVVPLPML